MTLLKPRICLKALVFLFNTLKNRVDQGKLFAAALSSAGGFTNISHTGQTSTRSETMATFVTMALLTFLVLAFTSLLSHPNSVLYTTILPRLGSPDLAASMHQRFVMRCQRCNLECGRQPTADLSEAHPEWSDKTGPEHGHASVLVSTVPAQPW